MLVKIGVCLEQEHIFYFDRLGITFSVYEELFQSVPAARADKAAIYPVQEVEVMPDERVLNLASLYAESFGIQRGNQLYFTVAKPAFLYCDDMFFIEGKDLTFATLTELFDLENVFFLLVINGDAGELFRGEYPGYTFTIRYRERNHHVPHIHVDYKHERSGSLRIEDGEMFEGGTLRKKEANVAKKVILTHKKLLQEAWNKLQLGLSQNLNMVFGNESIHRTE